MLTTLAGTAPAPISWDASFAKALNQFAARYAVPYQRTCAECKQQIFSADTKAICDDDGYGKEIWIHADCHLENVNTGAEVPGGSDATDDQSRPTDQELNEHFLLIKGWKRSDIWIDPLTGMTYLMGDALNIQNRREDELNG